MPPDFLPEDIRCRLSEHAQVGSALPGQTLFDLGQGANSLLVVVEGTVDVEVPSAAHAPSLVLMLGPGDFFGFECFHQAAAGRVSRARAITGVRIATIAGSEASAALACAAAPPDAVFAGASVASRKLLEALQAHGPALPEGAVLAPRRPGHVPRFARTLGEALTSPRLYLGLFGFILFFGLWQLTVDTFRLPRFKELPTLVSVLREWFSANPDYGLSLFVGEYYSHILISLERIGMAFFLATALGVPLGLGLGWSKTFREYIFPLFEILRPVPILAWVPLAIVMLPSDEAAVIFLTFIAAFFATTLNTMLGVQSIDTSYIRAAYCLGASHKQVFRHVVIPGSLPFIFTGLQIAVGIAWFSLVAAEMVSGQFGLGYVINTAYTKIQYPVIVIGMVTLGFVGYTTSALVRYAGRRLMAWRERELALSAVR